MKEIKDMNLAELAEIMAPYSDLKERIINRLRVIHEETRWIPVSERMPDDGEVVLCRRVEGGMFGSKEIKPQVGTFRNGSFDCVFDWIRVTHWQRITPPEDKP
jgi:hypothetical protein